MKKNVGKVKGTLKGIAIKLTKEEYERRLSKKHSKKVQE